MRKSTIKGIVCASLIALLLAVPDHAAAAKSVGEIADVPTGSHPDIKSAAALVVDLDTNAVLYEKDADVVRPIASISKLFGALVLVEDCKLPPDAMHEMSVANRDAARGGDKTKLTTGWSYSHRDLLHAALMRSDNRALPALAEDCGLDPAAFAIKMTEKARKLGLVKTTFKEPDGLSADNVSTAREVMIALKEAIKVPELTEIMAKADYDIVAHKGERTRTIKIKNTDRLLSKNLAQILGGKTGYTDIARYCLAIAARTFEGRQLGMVFLGAEGRFTRFADFSRVLKWLTPASAVAAEGPKTDDKRAVVDDKKTKAESPVDLLKPPHTEAGATAAKPAAETNTKAVKDFLPQSSPQWTPPPSPDGDDAEVEDKD